MLVTYNSLDGHNPQHDKIGCHGLTIGVLLSQNYKNTWRVAYNNQVTVIRVPEFCYCNVMAQPGRVVWFENQGYPKATGDGTR